MLKIYKNSIRCNVCGKEIVSDGPAVTCPCGNCTVKGGKNYLMRYGTNWTDTSFATKVSDR